MQGYVILMVILVVVGTILDMAHKQSAKYFFENAKRAQKAAKRQVSSSEKTSLAIKTVTNEVLTSSEFNNPQTSSFTYIDDVWVCHFRRHQRDFDFLLPNVQLIRVCISVVAYRCCHVGFWRTLVLVLYSG